MIFLFFLLTFSISWILWYLIGLTGIDINQNLVIGLAYVVGGFGPSLAGIYLAAKRKTTLAEFWNRVFGIKRIRPLFLLVILLLYPATIFLAYLIAGVLFPVLPGLSLSGLEGMSWPMIILTVLSILIIGPVSEELGWRGFALEAMQKKISPLAASLLIGVAWFAWHLPLINVVGSYLYNVQPTWEFIGGYLGTVLLYSILFTWVYNQNRRSILAVILMHFSINLTIPLLEPPYEVMMVTTFLLIVIAVVVLIKEKMWRRYP
jgi:uncharacterized protein